MNKIDISLEGGKILYGQDKMEELWKNNPDGQYMLILVSHSPKTEEEWRKYYFMLRDIVFTDGETGYSKSDIHEMAKSLILVKLINDEENFSYVVENDTPSTSWLSVKGWQNYVQLFKEWVFESFNCYL